MKQSQLATKTLREEPTDERSTNAILLTRGGFIDKLAAGIYSFLPLGLRVLRRIEDIIRQEMMALNAQEVLLPALHPKENWEKTGRWNDLDVLFKFKGGGEKDYALGATHEEIISPLAQKIILSYKDLPLGLFQIQTKFRDEPRAKSGLLRTREFLMKDLYSFHASQPDLEAYYEKVKKSYFEIFKRCGLDQQVYLTLASGGTFSRYSHEFQAVSPAGEDTIRICAKCGLAINEEIKKENPHCPACGASDFKEARAIEVGNIFQLGDKYAAPFDLKFKDQNGQEKMVLMACYGIGLARLMGAIVEISHDDQGLIWPETVAPFQYHLLALGDSAEVKKEALKLYDSLTAKGAEVLFDDREVSPGEKFADADLIGLPWRLVISEKTLAKDSVEIKKRNEPTARLVDLKKVAQGLLTVS